MKKRLLSLLLALALSLSLLPIALAAEPTFTDVSTEHWAYKAVEDMAKREVVNGFGDGTFLPGKEVTYAQFAKMMACLLFQDELTGHNDTAYWWLPYAEAMLGVGALDNTTVEALYQKLADSWDKEAMEAPMDRYNMAQVMYNVLKAKGAAMPSADELAAAKAKIADFASVPSAYTDAVTAMYAMGCLTGRDDQGSFEGSAQMTRAEACIVLTRLLDRLDDAQPAPDNSPAPSQSPAPSASPEPSQNPEPSASPEPSQNPEPSASPAPSQSPEPQPNISYQAMSLQVGEGLAFHLPAGATMSRSVSSEAGKGFVFTSTAFAVSYDYQIISSNPEVAEVSSNGRVLAIDGGQANIIVDITGNGLSQRSIYQVTVTNPKQVDQTPSITPTTPDADSLTEESVRAVLESLRSQYPEGMHWTNDNYYLSRALFCGGYGCEGFALICSDTAFGSLPARTHSNFDQIRAGDMLRVNNDTHTVVVLEKKENSVIVTEGNYNSSIHWGREITRQELEAGHYTVRTRYPD